MPAKVGKQPFAIGARRAHLAVPARFGLALALSSSGCLVSAGVLVASVVVGFSL